MKPTKFEGAYMAYPIDQRGPASLEYLFQQITKFKSMLLDRHLVAWTFDPGDAFSVKSGVELNPGMARINRGAARQAECLVAFLPHQVATVGVPMEIDRAVNDGIPTLVFADHHSWMLQITAPHFYVVNGYEDEDLDLGLGWLSMQSKPNDRKITDPLPVVVGPNGRLPTQSYEGDAGFDLYVSQSTKIQPGEFVDVPCDVRVELPFWAWAMVTGRSSALRKKGLLVHTGIIDQGYRGELFAGAFNLGSEPVWVEKGERVAQLIPINNSSRMITPWQTEKLNPSARGEQGFGSSGA